MLRFFLINILILLISKCFCQEEIKIIEVDSGKIEFKKQSQSDTPNYSIAYRILSNQVNLNPKNAESRYFLGYTIDRLNSDDGSGMSNRTKEMTIKASEQIEEVIKLEPIYKGELLLLDPYSKLSSIWGSLAAAYLNRKLLDSAKWAFIEGKKRGGFIEPVLEFNRQLLNSCTENSLLVTYGDNISIPIWYLQTIENFRNDVIVVDASLLNASWYGKYLKREKHLKLSMTDFEIDTTDYILWPPKIVEIVSPNNNSEKFSWELKPTYMDQYLLKGDRILLDILKQNFYTNPIYFISGSDSTYNLHLNPYLIEEGLVNRVSSKSIEYKAHIATASSNLKTYTIDKIELKDIIKSRDAIQILNYYRWSYFSIISKIIELKDYDNAKEIATLIQKKFNTQKLPFASDEYEQYFINLINFLETK
jgi:hypothetical protein